jgi:HEAT repeats/PQQ-like domain
MLPPCVVLFSLFALLGIASRVLDAVPEATVDEQVLRAARIPVDGPGLLEFFRKRTLSDEARARIQKLIAQFGSDTFSLREQASTELVSYGPGAVPLLRGVMHHRDLEIRWRARQALRDIERDSDPEILVTAVRMLGRHKAAQTAQVLLAYLPHAEDISVVDEVCLALASAAVRDGKADPVLVQALTDKLAVKRGVAAAALCRAGCPEQRSAVRRLLRDPDPLVRLRVASTLLEARDKGAVPVLIALLIQLPRAEAERVEEMLVLLAGERAPHGDLDGNDIARRRYRDAWDTWWVFHGANLELDKVEGLSRPLGHTLIAQIDLHGSGGRVLEIGAGGRTCWQIEDLQFPIHACEIDSQRVLITEYDGRRVTERNHKGEILWQKQVNSIPLSARRLANGNTFIVTRNRIYEVDRKGDEVWTLNHHRGRIASACCLRDGGVCVLYSSGEFLRLDHAGKVVKSFRFGGILLSIGTHIQVLPNGNVLVPFYSGNRVVEYDSEGKQVWSVQARRPTCVQRLPNGHTLISSRLSDLIVEVNRKGKELWTHRCEGRPMHLQRR